MRRYEFSLISTLGRRSIHQFVTIQNSSLKSQHLHILQRGRNEELNKKIEGFVKKDENAELEEFPSIHNVPRFLKRSISLREDFLRLCELDKVVNRVQSAPRNKGSVCFRECNLLIKALSKTGLVNEAHKLLERMHFCGMTPDSESYIHLMKAYGSASMPVEASRVFQVMGSRNVERSIAAYAAAMDAFAECGDVRGVERLWEELKRSRQEPNEFLYSALVKCHVRAGKPLEAEALLAEMASRRLQPGVVLFSQLLQLSFGSEPWKAPVVERRMRESGVAMDAAVFKVLVRGYASANMWENLKSTVEEMKKAKVFPGLHTFHAAIFSLSAGGHLEEALEILPALLAAKERPTAWTFNLLLRGMEVAGKPESAWKLLQSMEGFGVRPNGRTFHLVMSCLCQHGQVAAAEDVMDAMLASGIAKSPETHAILVRGAGVRRDWLLAQRLWSQSGQQSSESVKMALLEAAIMASEWEASFRLCNEVYFERLPRDGAITGDFEAQVCVDLHGLSTLHAKWLLVTLLHNLHSRYKGKSFDNTPQLSIVTGRGVHSKVQNYSCLRSQVVTFLRKDAHLGYHYQPWNHGRLIIRSAVLQKWIQNDGFQNLVNSLWRVRHYDTKQ